MFNPITASENIKNEFIDYITTTYSFADNGLKSQLKDELMKYVAKGPMLEISDVFKTDRSMEELISEGVLSPLFSELEKGKPDKRPYKTILPLKRKLYKHQVRAIRTITAGNNAVISTGTGSGKTNCFLIPVLNELLREKEAGTLSPGVRALFIYPMNALANDQLKNLRNILLFYPDIKFGVYNGATEQDEKSANEVYEAMFANEPVPELRKRLENEVLSRDEMKANPPHILFTNYAMLEHLLLRPKDDVLFSNADFKYVVLDEAHIYSGATGIETALLLGRLRARIHSSRQTQFILTSATLGSDEKSDGDIVKFARNLCGVDFSADNIIRAEREEYKPCNNAKHYPDDLYVKLADEENAVQNVLSEYGIAHNSSLPESELLYDLIASSDLYDRLRSSLGRISSISDLQKKLSLDSTTAIAFISLCTRAQKGGKLLLDARYHFFVRSLEGCFLAFSPSKKLSLTRQKYYYENDNQYAVFEIATCNDCGSFALVGKEENRRLEQVNKMGDKVDYFYLAAEQNDDIDDDTEELSEDANVADNADKTEKAYLLCKKCGALIPEGEAHNPACDCGSSNYIKVIKAKETKNSSRCGNCHIGTYRRFYLGNDAATGVLATALYEELPEIEFEDAVEEKSSGNIFAAAMKKRAAKKPKKTGRQFLAFSDSRQEAAKFACYLTKSYNEFLRRRGICRVIQENNADLISNKYSISDFVKVLTNFYSSKKTFAESNTDESNLIIPSRKNAWVALLNELVRYDSTTSLVSLGQIQFEYMGNSDDIAEAVKSKYNVSFKAAKNLLDLLAFEIVKTGAVITDSDSDIDDNDREYIFHHATQHFIKAMADPGKNSNAVHSWLPKELPGRKGTYYRTAKLLYVCRLLNVDEQKGFEFLEQYFGYLTSQDNRYCMVQPHKDGKYVMPAKNFAVKVRGDGDAVWYRCKKCGKVTPLSMNGKCISLRCDGEQEKIDPSCIDDENHFAKLYLGERMSPLFIKEHTAQLSKKESAEYQEQFIKKEINALSCSTTFEMGVDVGDLETVFLRDIPPMPSNYAQRAGRAGRSVNSVAYALTYAKLSSHDLAFFKEPEKMISGKIMPPLFKIDNEKIVRRHIYAIALSMFFAENEEQYNHNDAQIFINEKGYEKFIAWIESKPERLKQILMRSIPDVNNLYERVGIIDFGWIESFSGKEGVFTSLITEYESNVDNLKSLIKKNRTVDLNLANHCEIKLRIYTRNKLIDFLARGNILPRYGFPVDTVELYQNSTASNLSRLRLSRDLQVAIAEYAPSSEVVADGRLYTSRYIRKSAVGNGKKDWHTAYIGKCQNGECGAINYSDLPVTNEGVICSSCGHVIRKTAFSESIEPRSGFTAERIDKDVPMTKQEKNYRSDDFYIGDTQAKRIDKHDFVFNGIKVTVESTANDSLLVKSSNWFYVCQKCGYALAADETVKDKNVSKQMRDGSSRVQMTTKHESAFGQYMCDSLELHKRSLHHKFQTDVAKISFGCDTSDYKTMLSVMYAILYAISQELNIERKDIKACLDTKIINNCLSRSVIIYDAVPGGAGHSRRLVSGDDNMLRRIFSAAYKNMTGCKCDPSCYNCLRSYENQRIHDKLDRKLAAEFLKQLV